MQTNQALTSLGCISTTQPQPKEARINQPNKFIGTRSKFRSFVNQMCLVIQLHPHRYPNGPIQSWTHWHFIVKHNLCLVHTLVGALITLAQQL
jgi:hypothetical protein